MKHKYFIKKTNEIYREISEKFDGVQILKIEGFLAKGKPLNVYHQQWNNSQKEDYMVCGDKVIRGNKDITISFVISDKYAKKTIDVVAQHDRFVEYITSSDVYIKSQYVGRDVHAICVEEYEPSHIRLRDNIKYIMGTIKLHKIDVEKAAM